jgi:hypothetical protein
MSQSLSSKAPAEAYTIQDFQKRMLAFVASTGTVVGPIPPKLARMTGIPSWVVSAAA